ncbi:MAG: 2-dehydropantoate 2-reductase N-terminal domain-containing protein, partial [Anaerolineales bacterium]
MMTESATSVTIVGAGGIGCALGHALLSAGMEVTLVETDDGKLAWGREHGIAVDHQPAQPAIFERFDQWHPEPE